MKAVPKYLMHDNTTDYVSSFYMETTMFTFRFVTCHLIAIFIISEMLSSIYGTQLKSWGV